MTLNTIFPVEQLVLLVVSKKLMVGIEETAAAGSETACGRVVRRGS